MNWGKICNWIMAGMCFAASIGYWFAKDKRMAVYWLLAGLIAIDLAV